MSSFGDFRLKDLLLLCIVIVAQTHGYLLNQTIFATQHRQSKFTIDDLLNGQFSYKISEDIDMDPCKAGKHKSTMYLLFIYDKSFTN